MSFYLRPTACGVGEGHEVARGGIPYGVEAIAASSYARFAGIGRLGAACPFHRLSSAMLKLDRGGIRI